jgi:negative regulator of sigma E activity
MMIDDEKLMAFLDGELLPEESAHILEAAKHDAGLQRQIDEQRRLKAQLNAQFDPVAEEAVPDRFMSLLGIEADKEETEQTAELVDFAAAKQDREMRRNAYGEWRWPQLGAIAASLVIGLLAGQAIIGRSDAPSSSSAQGLVLAADDPLANALDTQLASTQDVGAPIRVGITFRNRQGQYCRTFDGPEINGLACRADGAWELALAVSDTASDSGSQFRQASSGSRIVLEYAQSVMDGEPVGADAEEQARDSDWSR